MRSVLESLGIFIPFEQYDTMLNAFKLSQKKYITYSEFLKVFMKTHYPQPFVRSTHLEPNEEQLDMPEYTTSPTKLRKSSISGAQSVNSLCKLLKDNPLARPGTQINKMSSIYSTVGSKNRRGASAYTTNSFHSRNYKTTQLRKSGVGALSNSSSSKLNLKNSNSPNVSISQQHPEQPQPNSGDCESEITSCRNLPQFGR